MFRRAFELLDGFLQGGLGRSLTSEMMKDQTRLTRDGGDGLAQVIKHLG